jgi:hypothetical protein
MTKRSRMARRVLRWVVLLAVALSLSCATSFTGSATVKDGVQGCEAKCSAQGLEFAGMVMMGEYTDGCVCAVPGFQKYTLESAAGVAGSLVGVALQSRRSAQSHDQQ